MIKCLIVDDEPLARQVLAAHVARTSELKLEGEYANALEAYEAICRIRPGLVFLDIKMPKLNGLDMLRSLHDPPAVIITTAYSEYAVEGFELEVIDYLVKPVTYERFYKSIKRLLKTSEPEKINEKDYTYFKVSGQLVKILHSELLYARSIKDYVQLHTTRGRYMTYMTMKYLSDLLSEGSFLRVHRSYLVNISYADRVDRNFVYIKDEQIPVGESYRYLLDHVKDW